jgi:hypothetical protein
LVVNDGGFDIFPDYFTLPDCCPLCCRPSDFQFADYLQFSDDPLDSAHPGSSSSTDASWTPPQAEVESREEPTPSNVLFGSDSSHCVAPFEFNTFQPSDLILYEADNGSLPEITDELSLNSAFKRFGLNIPTMAGNFHTGEQTVMREPSKTSGLSMNMRINRPLAPITPSSTVSPLLYETVHMDDIQASTTMNSPTQAFQAPDEGQACLPPSAGQIVCGWTGCQAHFKRVAELKHVAPSI